jgi:hypothetical protein
LPSSTPAITLLVLAKQKNNYELTDEELLAWEDEFQAEQAAGYGQIGGWARQDI